MKAVAYIKNKYYRRKFKRRNRSLGGDFVLFVVLAFFGIFSLFPLVYTLTSAFKPFSEIFMYPPKLTVENPTLGNFFDHRGLYRASFQVHVQHPGDHWAGDVRYGDAGGHGGLPAGQV